jgi:hypothetical protein
MNFCEHVERNSPSVCRNEGISKSEGSNERILNLKRMSLKY